MTLTAANRTDSNDGVLLVLVLDDSTVGSDFQYRAD